MNNKKDASRSEKDLEIFPSDECLSEVSIGLLLWCNSLISAVCLILIFLRVYSFIGGLISSLPDPQSFGIILALNIYIVLLRVHYGRSYSKGDKSIWSMLFDSVMALFIITTVINLGFVGSFIEYTMKFISGSFEV